MINIQSSLEYFKTKASALYAAKEPIAVLIVLVFGIGYGVANFQYSTEIRNLQSSDKLKDTQIHDLEMRLAQSSTSKSETVLEHSEKQDQRVPSKKFNNNVGIYIAPDATNVTTDQNTISGFGTGIEDHGNSSRHTGNTLNEQKQ